MNELETPSSPTAELLGDCLAAMGKDYRADALKAVRSQSFITPLHFFLGVALEKRLTPWAKRRGISIEYEAKILGSHKPKDVDVCVMDPQNGPLMLVGVRSQMSSIGKNALNYYEGIIGECISLQDRFPMSVHGYLYLMPVKPIKKGKDKEKIDHSRYAQMYSAIAGRRGLDYSKLRGIYDEMSYLVVDFETNPPSVRDDLIIGATPNADLRIETFVDRLVDTFVKRMLFWDVFTSGNSAAELGR